MRGRRARPSMFLRRLLPGSRFPTMTGPPLRRSDLWRQQSFGVNYLNNAFNIAEIERQTKDGEEVRRGWRYIGYCYYIGYSFSNTYQINMYVL
jgi:hypothetical protein